MGQERKQKERRSEDADWKGATQAGGNTFKKFGKTAYGREWKKKKEKILSNE